MSDVVLYLVLSIFTYGNAEPSIIEVRLPQDSMEKCEKTLDDLEIVEGPEIAIFGTKLDIEAYCFSVDNFMTRLMNEQQ